MKKSKVKMKTADLYRESSSDLPEFDEGENENFVYASSKIKMR